MNFKKFINSDYLKNNPLCGIGTYKDELNLATGDCTRNIKKKVFNGSENWTLYNGNFFSGVTDGDSKESRAVICSHIASPDGIIVGSGSVRLKVIKSKLPSSIDTTDDFKDWITEQYNNDTPFTLWYILKTPTTETITVPSGLSGTEEGYLNQSGTPTPTNPIYPTANTVEKWFDINHYIMETSTDTITTPAVVYPNDNNATVGLKGNMYQASGVSPTTPIQPQECGERTGNLLDKTGFTDVGATIEQIEDGIRIITRSGGYAARIVLDVLQNTDYTVSYIYKKISGSGANAVKVFAGTGDSTEIKAFYSNTGGTFNTGNNTKINIWFYASFGMAATVEYTKIMLNTGNTALPYEPYGVKIPILNNSQTTNVYLGEVQTVRKVKKLVLTGDEGFTEVGSGGIFRLSLNGYLRNSDNVPYSTHYNGIAPVSAANQIPNDTIAFLVSGSGNNYLYIRDDTYINSVTNFKTYLQQQYAAGTPVCIWYVLANPETAVVNEPLRKIGDYADTVSGITIPTIAGTNTIDVDTTLKPSEVSVNYHGWHPVSAVHERENGQWD